jgi:hypothetical protein
MFCRCGIQYQGYHFSIRIVLHALSYRTHTGSLDLFTQASGYFLSQDNVINIIKGQKYSKIAMSCTIFYFIVRITSQCYNPVYYFLFYDKRVVPVCYKVFNNFYFMRLHIPFKEIRVRLFV